MAAFSYKLFTSSSLLSLGLYHLFSTTRNHLKSPQSYSAKPYHPLSPPSLTNNNRSRYLQLYLLMIFLLAALFHQTLTSFITDPLVKGSTPVHLFSTLQSAAVLFIFLILTIALFLSESTSLLPLSSDCFFGLASAAFYLQYSVSSGAASIQTSDLQAECDSLSGRVSAICSVLCLLLACWPKLFVADLALGASLCLHGLWELQTGLSLYVDAFIPEGCHTQLDVVKGVDGSTKCDLDESRLRAVAVLDLMFVVHVMFVIIIVLVTYAIVAKNGAVRRSVSYEVLPTNSTEANHVQMKALSGTQA